MGRQRNNLQLKGKEESPERVLNEIEASKLSDIEFKTMIIRKLTKFSENYQNTTEKLQETYCELHQFEKTHKNYQ